MTLAECFDKETSRRFIIVVFPDSRELKCPWPALRLITLPFLVTKNLLEIVLLVFIFIVPI